MFRDLYAVARHTPLTLVITPRGEQLSVIVMPKPSGDAADNPALAQPISAIGTPEELEADLPAAIRRYAEKVNALRTAIDLPIEALDEAQAKAQKKAAKPAAAPKPAAKPTPQPKAAKRQAKATPKPKQHRTPAASAAKKVKLPRAAGARPPAPLHRANKPDKAACVADYHALVARAGHAPTRREFIKMSQTGRRYEKLWKNWEEFLAETVASQSDPANASAPRAPEQAAPKAEAGPSPSAVSTEIAATEPVPSYEQLASDLEGTEYSPARAALAQTAADLPGPQQKSATQVALDPGDPWPFPIDKPRDVYTEAGEYLSSITTAPHVGDPISLIGRPPLRVTAIEERDDHVRVTVTIERKISEEPHGTADANA